MPEPVVSLVVSTWLYGDDARRRGRLLDATLASLFAQTFDGWAGVVVHNGPDPDGRLYKYSQYACQLDLWRAPEPRGQWGHPWRLDGARLIGGKYVGFVNDDGYYAPPYLERMAAALEAGADLALCDFVHGFTETVPGYEPYQPLSAAPQVGRVDVGGFLARRELVLSTPWPEYDVTSDGRYVAALAANAGAWVRVPQLLYVHN